MKRVKTLSIFIICLIIIIVFISIFFHFTSERKICVAINSDNSKGIDQKRNVVLLDLNKKRIIKTIYSYDVGHDLEAAVSSDRKRIAYNKWGDNRMDRNLFISDIDSNAEKQLTADIDGEIDRISWIDNDNILYCFAGHNSAEFGYGEYIYIWRILGSLRYISAICR